jgi:4-amino-4-deoxy-L-arabinose transferase-like glycosyltransferase
MLITKIQNSVRSLPVGKFKINNYLPLTLLILIYLLVALAHDALAPLTTGPDELAHYEYVRFISDHGRLPRNTEERDQASYKSDQPPLYHWLAALPARLVDPAGPPFLKRVGDNPRRQLIERTRHAWGLYNTEDEQWPYRAEVLRWHTGRWVAIFFGAATVAVTYFITRNVLANPHLALAAAAVVAFTPRYVLTGSMLNYETALAFFSALFLWLLLRISQSPISQSPFSFIILGLSIGLAITAKLSAIILPLEILAAFWLMGRFYGLPWRRWVRWLGWAALGTIAGVGWWFGFILYHFNTVAADGLWVGLLHPLIAADSSDATTNRLLSFLTGGQAGFTAAIENLDSGPPWQWAATFFRTFWVAGIEEHQPLGLFGLLIALGLVVLASYGLLTLWLKEAGKQRSRGAGAQIANLPSQIPLRFAAESVVANHYSLSTIHYSLLLLHLAAAIVLPLVRYAATFSLADTAQGRHVLFQAAPAFAVLLIYGLVEAVPALLARLNGRAPYITLYVLRFRAFLAPTFLLGWTLTQLYTMTWAYLPLLPVQTGPAAAAQINVPLTHPFNPAATLAGYTLHPVDNQRLSVDLLWQAIAVSPVDYLTQVTLVDSQGAAQAQWLGHPAGGRYPTRAWDPGDFVRDTVHLPAAGLPAGAYYLDIALIPTASALSAAAPTSSYAELPLRLPAINLPNIAPAEANFQIWQNGQAVTAPKTFRYRETILVTLSPALARASRQVQINGPAQNYTPDRDWGSTVLFIVGPNWPTGDFHLHITPAAGPPLESGPLIQVVDRWQRQFDSPPISHLVEANFANQAKLLGYNLGANRAKPGGGIPLTLYWQGFDWLGYDYTIFTKLIKTDDRTVHGGRDRLPQEGYRTLYWAPGEIVADPFGVPVDPAAPDGIYRLSVGLYREVNGQAVSLPLVRDGQPLEATSVEIGPLKIGRTPPGFTVESAHPQTAVNQIFGNPPALTLLGYDLAPEHAARNTHPLTVTLYWQVNSTLLIDYTTFVHLRNAAGETVAQKDQPPLGGVYPTSLWEPGEIIADDIVMSLPENLPAGAYRLVVGLYDFNTWERLPVPGNTDNEVKLADVDFP